MPNLLAATIDPAELISPEVNCAGCRKIKNLEAVDEN